MMHGMHRSRLLVALLLAALPAACSLHGPPRTTPPGAAGTATQTPGQPPPAQEQPAAPLPGERPAPAQRQFTLGAAASALVAQAHRQSAAGDFGQAAATLERALRIEPDNPLLWTELGRVRLGENDPAQADAMGRKALALSTGDPQAQSGAWRLIADAFRAQGRNPEASEADRHAAGLAPR